MLELVFERVKGIILNPVENFRLAVNDTMSFTLVYYFILLAVFGILFTFTLSGGFGMFMLYSIQGMTAIILMLAQMIVSLFIGALWLHVWVYILGGRKGVRNTLKVVAYAMTPTLLLGWLFPVGMIVGSAWYLVLEVIGIRELQQLPTGRAVLAVALAIAVGIVIYLVVLFMINPDFLSSLFGAAGTTQSTSYRSSYSY
nr:Yip1 family protein [uncultured Methanoregula sp.]